MLIGAIIAAVIAVAMSIYSYVQMRKMQKKNRPKPSQLDGTIADEGTSFCDIAGSPHVHANITDIWGKSTQAIKKKSGGFLGIGKTSQVTGYRYYAKFAAFIGNRIEKLIAINFDNRKWVLHDPTKHPVNMLPVREGNLFGENEGGVAGDIDIHFGYPDQEPNLEYQKYFPLVSGYPYQSYLLFRGYHFQDPFLGHTFTTPAFYLGNSGYMKEMLLWVKRTRVRNDGRGQWYEVRPLDDAIVCEIGLGGGGTGEGEGGIGGDEEVVEPTPLGTVTVQSSSNYYLTPEGIRTSSDSVTFNTVRLEGYPAQGTAFNLPGRSIEYTGTEEPVDHTVEYTLIFNNGTGSVTTIFGAGMANIGGRPVSPDMFSLEVKEPKDPDAVITSAVDEERGKRFFVTLRSVPATLKVAITCKQYKEPLGGYFFNHTVNFWGFYQAPVMIKDHNGGGGGLDINPIHKIREILTDDTAMGKPESDINDENFKKAADRIYNEGLGVSWAIDEKSCIEAIEELCYHIEAGIRVNRQTGLYEMVLFRDDWFEESEIHTIAENKIKDLSLEVMNSDDIVNQLNVTYYDRERIKNSTFSVYENGSILTMGHANAESVEFPYFMNMRNAEIVANWKLKQFSTPAWSGTFTTGWREARKWNRYDLIRLPWSKKWNGTILARIMKIDLGNGLNNEVMIDFEEVIPYSGEMNTSIVVDDSMETKPMPPQPAIFKTFEIPYYDLAQLKTQAELDLELSRNQDIGFVAAVAGRPQPNSIDAQLHIESNVGYELVSSVEYASFARTDEAVNRTQQSFVIKNEDLSVQFRQDSLIMIGDEIVIYKSYDAETKTLTVERGALDTVPQNHIENTVLYFYDDAFAYDPEGYMPPKTVNATVLTTTPSGIESLETSPKRQVQIESRAIRPYPPANVKINGEYWPEEIETDLTITWAHRNRVQQTTPEILGWYESSATLEDGVEYIVELRDDYGDLVFSENVGDDNSVIVDYSDVETEYCRIKLYSVRDGYESLQAFEHRFKVGFAAPYDVNATYDSVNNEVNLTWEFDE